MRRRSRRFSRNRRRGSLPPSGGDRVGGGGRGGGDEPSGPTSPEPRHPILGVVLAVTTVVLGFVLIPVLLVAGRIVLALAGFATMP